MQDGVILDLTHTSSYIYIYFFFNRQLGQKRTFAKGVEYNPDTGELAGVQTLQDYQTQGHVDAYLEEMKTYGLTLEEILYKMQAEEDTEVSFGTLNVL